MKAIFIIFEDDPEDYFEEMEKMKHRITDTDGTWTCTKHYSEKKSKYYFEYRFKSNGKLEDLIL